MNLFHCSKQSFPDMISRKILWNQRRRTLSDDSDPTYTNMPKIMASAYGIFI